MKMKSALSLLLMFGSNYAMAWPFEARTDEPKAAVKYSDDWKNYDAHVYERLTKIRSLIERDNQCYVSMYAAPLSVLNLNRSQYVPEALEQSLPTVVTCIGNITVAAHTIREKNGCALVRFDSGSGTLIPFFNNYFPTAISSKLCENGGFEDVLSMKGNWSGNVWNNSTVEEAIFSPTFDEKKEWRYILLFAANPNAFNWFTVAHERGAAFVAAKLKKKKN